MANVIFGTAAAEFLSGSEEADIIYTNGGADNVWGFGGNDTLVQRGGTANAMYGGAGNDVYVIFDGSTSSASEFYGSGIDTLRTYVTMTTDLGAGIENIENIFYGGALTLRGNELNNRIICGAASDTAYGRDGNDYILGSQYNPSLLYGEEGNDTLIGGNAAGGDSLDGGNGNDTLEGRLGPDGLRGLAGNDTYILTNDTTDIITEVSGIDTVTSTISRNLTGAQFTQIENLTLLLSANVNGVGNGLANLITGNAGGNLLDGGLNNDILRGLGGNDTLIGNAGRDILTGGLGNDTFRFLNKAHSFGASTDTITDFDRYGDDRIDVSALFGPAMTYRHNLAFTAAGQVRISDIAGPDVIVEVNTGGTLSADFTLRLTATTLASMTASDFVL